MGDMSSGIRMDVDGDGYLSVFPRHFQRGEDYPLVLGITGLTEGVRGTRVEEVLVTLARDYGFVGLGITPAPASVDGTYVTIDMGDYPDDIEKSLDDRIPEALSRLASCRTLKDSKHPGIAVFASSAGAVLLYSTLAGAESNPSHIEPLSAVALHGPYLGGAYMPNNRIKKGYTQQIQHGGSSIDISSIADTRRGIHRHLMMDGAKFLFGTDLVSLVRGNPIPSVPTLLLVGDQDGMATLESHKAFYDALSHPKEMAVYEHQGHDLEPESYKHRLIDFIVRHATQQITYKAHLHPEPQHQP